MSNQLAQRVPRDQRRSMLANRIVVGSVATVGAALLLASPVSASPLLTGPIAVHTQSPSADAINKKYTDFGGATTPLGNPAGEVAPAGAGAVRDYEGGAIYYSEPTGAHVTYGVIQEKYRELGGPTGDFGFPTNDESDTPGGRVSEFSAPGGAAIYWTPESGAWPVRGPLLAAYKQLGGPAGELGGPIGDQTEANGEFVQKFSGANGTGEVRWSQAGGFVTVPAALASQLANVQIPGGEGALPGGAEASGAAATPGAEASANAGASATAENEASAPTSAVNADDEDDNGSSVWKWLLPLIIALVVLGLLWALWKFLRGRGGSRPTGGGPRLGGPDTKASNLRGPELNRPNVKAPEVKRPEGGFDINKGAVGGAAAAAAAGAAGLGAKAKGAFDRDVDRPDIKKPDLNAPKVDKPDRGGRHGVDTPDVNAPKGNAPKFDSPKLDGPDAKASEGDGFDWKKGVGGAVGGAAAAGVAGASGLGDKIKGVFDRDKDGPDTSKLTGPKDGEGRHEADPDSKGREGGGLGFSQGAAGGVAAGSAAVGTSETDVAGDLPKADSPKVDPPKADVPKVDTSATGSTPGTTGRHELTEPAAPEAKSSDDSGLDWKKGAAVAGVAGAAGLGAKATGAFDKDSDSDTQDSTAGAVTGSVTGSAPAEGAAAGTSPDTASAATEDDSADDGGSWKKGAPGGAAVAGTAGAAGLGAKAAGSGTDAGTGASAGAASSAGATSSAASDTKVAGTAPAWVNKKVVGTDSKLESLFDGLGGTDDINKTYAEVITSASSETVAGQSFLIDENLSPKVAGLLRDAGYDAIHVHDANLRGGNNEQVLAKAKADGRTLITGELSYVDDLIGGDTGPSLLLLRRGGATIDEQGSVITSSLPHVASSLSAGALVALAADRIRARRLPLQRG